jgi:hypothetical protein
MTDHPTADDGGDGGPDGRPGASHARSATDEDLRATSESIRTDGAELSQIETQKLALDPADPQVDDLSLRAVELAERIVIKTRAERQLAEDRN